MFEGIEDRREFLMTLIGGISYVAYVCVWVCVQVWMINIRKRTVFLWPAYLRKRVLFAYCSVINIYTYFT